MIEVKELVKRYGGVTAVDHLSFQVEEGQICGFLGPNGAGKSTTMNMLTGYLSPTEGSIRVNGYDMGEEPEKAKGCIGYLPEIPPVYTDMTPWEYLFFAGQIKGVSKKKLPGEVLRVMGLTGLEEMKTRLIGNLSKGYRQRVGFACALLGDPKVIILDEPTVGLDPRQIMEIRNLIRSLRGDHTVILSSHILSEISAVCDHVMILSRGRLAACGPTDQISSLIKGGSRYRLLVQGGEEKIREALSAVPGISYMETGPDSSGFVCVQAEAENGQDPRAEMFRALARIDCPIMELSAKQISLEEAFLELTMGEEVKTDEGDL